MKLHDLEVKTIEEAFSLLPVEQQEHAQRVAAYTEIAFSRACAKELYIDTLYGKTEMVIENKSFAREAGLYHDIGKLCDGEKEYPPDFLELLLEHKEELGVSELPAPDHTLWGPYLIRKLYPRFRSSKTYHQRMLINGVGDHHERMDGTGTPWRAEGKTIGLMGRIVAIADELDHRVMTKRSEDPIGAVLKDLKAAAEKEGLDEQFVKCFSASAEALRKVFEPYREKTLALPRTEMWVKRREGRPMELRYKKCRDRGTDRAAWLAEMRFRDTKEGYIPYDAVRKLIASRKIGPELGTYFLYELCDAVSRFEQCGVDGTTIFIELPESWYSQKKLDECIARVLKDEKLTASYVTFLIPESLLQKPTKQFTENLTACAAAGYRLLKPEEAAKAIEVKKKDQDLLRTDDEIIADTVAHKTQASGEESGATG